MDINIVMDIDKLRKDTRGCANVIHFNNAGSSLMPALVADTLQKYLKKEEMYGGYETANREQALVDNFYIATAKLLNCNPDEIAFVENATRAWDMAFYSFRFEPGDKILTTIAEYGSNVVAYLHRAQQTGVEIVFVPNDEFGQIDLIQLEQLIDSKTKLISISHIPTGGGLVNPAAKVGKIAKKHGIPFLLDSCQGVGQIPIDVDALGCDVLCGTGRKYLRGPRGTGFLYVRRSLIEKLNPPLLDQHAAELISESEYKIRSDAKRFENWEQNFAGKAALGVAIDYALSLGLQNIKTRTYSLADQLRHKLTEIDSISVMDDGIERCGIVTFMVDGISPQTIKIACAERKINVTTPKGSGSLVSYERRGITELVRASVHYYNTFEEIDFFCEVINELVLTEN